jgi:DNA primase catalytic subunit
VATMVRYNLPAGMRYSTLEERNQFYTTEFNPQKVVEWFSEWQGKVKLAVIIGRHTRIYPKKYRAYVSTKIVIDEYKDLEDLRQQVIDFLPEAVYYDRNIYDINNRKVSQELAFDLDPENITCPIHGSLEDKMKRQQGLSFCELEFEMVKQKAISLYEHLKSRFLKVRAVYSGRGFHLHVFDHETYIWNAQERLEYAQQLKEEGFQIDEWVTSGEMSLIRLPYSLNGLVSRIVLPLEKNELKSFDPIHDKRCLPRFIDKKAIS